MSTGPTDLTALAKVDPDILDRRVRRGPFWHCHGSMAIVAS